MSAQEWFAEGRTVRDENRLTVCTASSIEDTRLIAQAPAAASLLTEIRTELMMADDAADIDPADLILKIDSVLEAIRDGEPLCSEAGPPMGSAEDAYGSAIRYVITEGQLVRLYHDRPESAIDCGAAFDVLGLLQTMARMETEDEINDRTNDDGMSGDDAVETVSSLIVEARKLIAKAVQS